MYPDEEQNAFHAWRQIMMPGAFAQQRGQTHEGDDNIGQGNVAVDNMAEYEEDDDDMQDEYDRLIGKKQETRHADAELGFKMDLGKNCYSELSRLPLSQKECDIALVEACFDNGEGEKEPKLPICARCAGLKNGGWDMELLRVLDGKGCVFCGGASGNEGEERIQEQ
jgi:hypothetical protein